MKRTLFILCCFSIIVGCAPSIPEPKPEPIWPIDNGPEQIVERIVE